ncbi:hypothetical protein Tco_0646818 [Tanacetum coccineum]
MSVDDLLHLVPQLMTRVDSLEKDLKQTKLTMGSAIVKLVKKVKKLEGILKRKNVGRNKFRQSCPTTLEAAKTHLSGVASQKLKSIDKGRRYKRRKGTKGKKVVTSLDFQEEVNTSAEGVNTAEEVNIGNIKVSTVSGQVSTDSINKSIPSPDKGQREGKAPMIIEEAPKNTKEQILQEEASLAEGHQIGTLEKKKELNQPHYTDEDWDLIRAKIEANAELTWKLSPLDDFSFEEVKEEFDKLVSRVHCLNLESMDIYMLIERQYPLSAEVCKAMLDKKLQGGKPDEDCYKLLKWMEKQAGIRK